MYWFFIRCLNYIICNDYLFQHCYGLVNVICGKNIDISLLEQFMRDYSICVISNCFVYISIVDFLLLIWTLLLFIYGTWIHTYKNMSIYAGLQFVWALIDFTCIVLSTHCLLHYISLFHWNCWKCWLCSY